MRGFWIFCLCVGFISLNFTAYPQQLAVIKPKKPIICYESGRNNPDHIDAPKKFRLWRDSRSGRAKTATIEVEYINFSADNQAKNAFQFAVDIWETELKSSVTIKIRAQWSPLASGVLGQAIWGTAFANFDGAQHLNTFYPVALAEKMAGRELNPTTEPDIVATFSSNTNWYSGTDGFPPAGKMDLVTIVLHEIAHGLGFTDTYSVDNNLGAVGLENGGSEVPFAYDLFVENSTSQRLFSQFPSASAELKTQLTSNNLFYNSPLAFAATGSRPRLYAPSTFNDGSSIAHLDESTYVTPGDANKLMTPQIAFMESIHDPGSILLSMFSDMGWVFTKIEHARLKDTERKDGAPYTVKTKIISDNGYDANQVKLHYTTDNVNFTELVMSSTGVQNEFQADLPGTTTDKSYGYFISTIDILNRTFTNPGKIQIQNQQAKQDIIVFHIGADTVPPEITHTPVDYIFEGETQLELSAAVIDNIGVDQVFVEYSVNGGSLQTAQMAGIENEYQVNLTLPAGLVIGNKIEYRIKSRDISSAANEGIAPDSDFYTVFVTGIMPTQDFYVNDFNQSTTDFIGNSFSITTPTGFTNDAIQSKHPYDNGTGPNDESNYVYQLQVPIRINSANPFIQFNEIVLVEPGEEGSVFGDSDFYDYVIVEGSKDGGASWKFLTDGYDSRAQEDWLEHYNSKISNDNSAAKGDPGLFKERTINILENGNFTSGDEILIRFRLFADQAAHGWGWAIDNLSIQGPTTGVEQAQHAALKVYPNPAKAEINIELGGFQPGIVNLQILNIQGQEVYNGKIRSEKNTRSIDVSSLHEGIYLVKATINGRLVTRKFLKID